MPSSERTSPARQAPRGRADAGHARPRLAAVPDAPAPPPEGSRRVPGSTDWAYTPGAAVWRWSRADDRWVKQLAWCPEVSDAVRYPSQDGRTITRSFKITVGDQTEVVSAGDLVRGMAWPKFAIAAGFTGRVIGDVLVNIVTDQASQLPDVIGYPYFHDGLLRLPPAEYLPDGYTCGESSTLAALTALVAAVAPYPVAALQMGLSAIAPWVGALQSQPFTLHLVGDSTVGKSTALYACASLWGVGYRRVAPPWAGTKIGIPGSFRDLGVLPAFRDELGTAGLPPADRVALFTTIMEGCRRTARTRDDLARPSASWESVCFSTGNIAAVPASHASAGTPKGLIEIHADKAKPVIPAEAKAHVRQLTNAPEVAGAWVPYALRLLADDVRIEVERAGKDLGDPDADGLEWHMWRAMSLALAGARVLAGVTGVPELVASAELAAREVIAATEDRLADLGADHGIRLIETVREYLSIRPAAFGLGDPRDNAHADQIGFEAGTADGAELICVFPAKHGEIARAAEVEDVTTALRQLRESGLLRTTKGKGLRYAARRDDRIVHVYAYNLNAETGGNRGNGGNNAGQEAGERYPLGGNTGPGQGVTGPESAPESPDLGSAPDACGLCGEHVDNPAIRDGASGQPWHSWCAEPGPEDEAEPEPEPEAEPESQIRHASADFEPEDQAVNEPATGPGPGPEPEPGAPDGPAPDDDHGQDSEPAQTRSEPRAEVSDADELAHFTKEIRKVDADATDADIAAGLAIFHEVTGGVRWVSYAGQVGQAWFSMLAAKHASMKRPEALTSPILAEITATAPLTRVNFVDKPKTAIRPGKHFVTSYDANGQYPAAAGSADLGDGEPVTVDKPRSIDGLVSLPGYVELATQLRTGHPAFGTIPAGRWVAMPLVKFLVKDLGLTVPADQVVYWPKHGRRLSAYISQYRTARERLTSATQTGPVRVALIALKSQANVFISMFNSETYSHGGFYRPDWNHMVVATAEANALRHFYGPRAKCKVAPVAKMTDAVYFVADKDCFVPDGLEMSDQLGKWKPDRHGPVTDELVKAIRESRTRQRAGRGCPDRCGEAGRGMRFTSLISQIGKPQNVVESLTNRPSKWIAQHFGVSRRTAQRWKAGSQQPGKRVGGPDKVMGRRTRRRAGRWPRRPCGGLQRSTSAGLR